MIKCKDKKLYNINFELYASGKVKGKVSGKANGVAQNYLLLVSGDFGDDLYAFLIDEKYVLAGLLADFLTAQPEILQAVNEIMGNQNDEGEIMWN